MTVVGWERVIKRAYELFIEEEEEDVSFEEFRHAVMSLFQCFVGHIRKGLFPVLRLKYFGSFVPQDRFVKNELIKSAFILRKGIKKGKVNFFHREYYELLLNYARTSEHIRQILPESIEAYDTLLEAVREGNQNDDVGTV